MSSIMEFRNVTKEIDGHEIVKNLNFKINQGDIIAYIGPNGAGKTTTIRLMTEIYKPSSGEIIKNVKKVGIVLDKDGLYDNLTSAEQLNYVNMTYKGEKLNEKNLFDVLKKVGLQNEVKKKIGKYSKGMKKRLSIACLLLTEPELIILDEPFTGLDPGGQKLMKDIMREISRDASIFVSSHNLSLIGSICNRVIFLKNEILFDERKTEEKDLEKIYFDLVKGENDDGSYESHFL